ncbi:MAG: hypothetical protein QOG34_2551 [Frankiaceae bacterium]|jgi:hypothetical protein|nr:hypothetical protein [Frankiaceae bacterium]
MTWAPDYVVAADVATYLRIDDSLDNAELASWATAASRMVDDRCNRQFGSTTLAARTYRRPPAYDPVSGLWLLEIDDVQSTTGLLVSGVAYATSGAVLLPDNAAVEGRPWERLGFAVAPIMSAPGVPSTIVVTAAWGWTAVPVPVIQACKLQCKFWSDQRDKGADVQPGMTRLEKGIAASLAGLHRRRRVG